MRKQQHFTEGGGALISKLKLSLKLPSLILSNKLMPSHVLGKLNCNAEFIHRIPSYTDVRDGNIDRWPLWLMRKQDHFM